jgi:hypothetical protein
MAAGDTRTKTTGLRGFENQGVTLTGLSNNTDYAVEITYPSGRVQRITVTTNGSGQATVPPVPAYETGTYTMVVNSLPAQVYTTSWRA